MRAYFLVLLLLLCATGWAAEELPLKTIQDIRSLAPEVAAKRLPVQLESQAFWIDPLRHAMFINDGKRGIYVRCKQPWEGVFPVRPGDLVRVTGVTTEGGFTPAIRDAEIEVIGRESLPEPVPYGDEFRMSPLIDCRWMSMRGRLVAMKVYEELNMIALELMRNFYTVHVQVPLEPGAIPHLKKMMFEWVNVNAIVGVVPNERRQLTRHLFYANSAEGFERVRHIGSWNNAGPKVSIGELLQISGPGHQIVNSEGVVTAVAGLDVFLRGENIALKAVVSDASGIQPGDMIYIEGFPYSGEISPIFRTRKWEQIRKEQIPEPHRVDSVSIMRTDRNFDWVQLDAELLQVDYESLIPGNTAEVHLETILLCREDERVFEARLPPGVDVSEEWKPGARIRLTGIAHLIRNQDVIWELRLEGFWLQLLDQNGVKLISAAPWWTPFKLMVLASMTLVLAVLFLVWVILLRRTVDRQTALIAEKIQHETLLEERQRMARELHDNLDQGLTGSAIQLQGSRKFLGRAFSGRIETLRNLIQKSVGQVPELERDLEEVLTGLQQDADTSLAGLDSAQRMLTHCGEESRLSIMDLRDRKLERMELGEALQDVLTLIVEEGDAQLEFKLEGNVRRLKYEAERQLFQVAREAVINAVRHAQPKVIRLELNYTKEALKLSIVDDGTGFEVDEAFKAGHFGLQGMQERIQRLKGDFNLISQQGVGTRIQVHLSPLEPWLREVT
ncbi:MAG: ATP-binding protein [Verrucomicrobiota bacterium]